VSKSILIIVQAAQEDIDINSINIVEWLRKSIVSFFDPLFVFVSNLLRLIKCCKGLAIWL
ncbi:hypothetical protein, partial [Acinetobacter baumannii]|uniref:hypothetical protein n=1 Tax=Acinetobacter baumannii TaxID=470 RepID=UPI001BB46D73